MKHTAASLLFSLILTAVSASAEAAVPSPVPQDAATDPKAIVAETRGPLRSCRNVPLNVPPVEMSKHLTPVGFALGDRSHFYWCVSGIQDEKDGTFHLFAARWPNKDRMAGWHETGELVHFTAKTPAGPYTEAGVLLSNATLPNGQRSVHNVRVDRFGDTYSIVYIVQTKPGHEGQSIAQLTSNSLNGPWKLTNGDGIILRREDARGRNRPDIENSGCGVSNPDIVRLPNGRYCLYFKHQHITEHNGKPRSITRYSTALADRLTGPYTITEKQATDNPLNIEDAEAFVYKGTPYLLTTDNFGSVTGLKGACILWPSCDGGLTFRSKNTRLAVGRFSDYIIPPKHVTYPYNRNDKFERPSLLFINGEPKYFIAPTGANILRHTGTHSFILSIDTPTPFAVSEGPAK